MYITKYYYGMQNGYFVDIGGYDPIYASNTLNLHSMGWEGVNVEANPDRHKLLLLSRHHESNVNYAIGEKDQIATLY